MLYLSALLRKYIMNVGEAFESQEVASVSCQAQQRRHHCMLSCERYMSSLVPQRHQVGIKRYVMCRGKYMHDKGRNEWNTKR